MISSSGSWNPSDFIPEEVEGFHRQILTADNEEIKRREKTASLLSLKEPTEEDIQLAGAYAEETGARVEKRRALTGIVPDRVLKASEAIPAVPTPPLTDAMTEEHELFHEGQNLSFPHRCPFCFEDLRQKVLAENEKQNEPIVLPSDARDSGGGHAAHLARQVCRKSCIDCQQTTWWEELYGSLDEYSKNRKAGGRSGRKLTFSLSVIPKPGGDVFYMGAYANAEELRYARFYAYKLLKGDASHISVEPNGITEFQKEAVKATVEARLKTVRGRI